MEGLRLRRPLARLMETNVDPWQQRVMFYTISADGSGDGAVMGRRGKLSANIWLSSVTLAWELLRRIEAVWNGTGP